MMPIRVVAVVGSHRRNGNTELVVRMMAERLAGYGIETDILPLAGKRIEQCRACDQCKQLWKCPLEDDLVEVMDRMVAAQGIILASPVYSFTVTPLMQTLITRGNRYFHLVAVSPPGRDHSFSYAHAPFSALGHKVGAAVTVARRAGGGAALASLHAFMLVNDMYLVGSSYEASLFGYDRGAVAGDEEGVSHVHRLAENMALLLQRLW